MLQWQVPNGGEREKQKKVLFYHNLSVSMEKASFSSVEFVEFTGNHIENGSFVLENPSKKEEKSTMVT